MRIRSPRGGHRQTNFPVHNREQGLRERANLELTRTKRLTCMKALGPTTFTKVRREADREREHSARADALAEHRVHSLLLVPLVQLTPLFWPFVLILGAHATRERRCRNEGITGI